MACRQPDCGREDALRQARRLPEDCPLPGGAKASIDQPEPRTPSAAAWRSQPWSEMGEGERADACGSPTSHWRAASQRTLPLAHATIESIELLLPGAAVGAMPGPQAVTAYSVAWCWGEL